MHGLAAQLFREVQPEFFRVLSGPLARLYVDALDALERESSRRNQGLDREEALALVEQAVELHSDLAADGDDPVAKAVTIRDKARAVVDTLRAAGWLQEEERSDWQKLVLFDPNGVLLIQAIRKIAFPDAAVFSDKLVNVCTTLANPDALAEEPWGQIESCIASIQSGLTELRAMQKSIEGHTKQQLAAATLAENLSLVFDRFAERIGRSCYAQLVHARLPSKLAEARRSLENLQANPELLPKMQTEVMHRGPGLAPETAMAKVRLRLNELEELLYQVEPLADAIDQEDVVRPLPGGALMVGALKMY